MSKTTTLKALKEDGFCEDGYEKLLNNLGKKRADTEPLTLEQIYNSNGYKDALWCTRLMVDTQPLVIKFAAACARRVLHIYEKKYPGDNRPRKAIEAAESGNATAMDAARTALAAASDIAVYAAFDAAARDARAAVSSAAYAAANAAFAAGRSNFDITCFAADAARAAVRAAAAAAAADNGGYAEGAAQDKLFREIFFITNTAKI